MTSTASSKQLALQVIEAFWETYPPTWHGVRAHIHKTVAEEFEITGGQFHILRRIHKGHNSVSQLADVRHTSRATISRTVDDLVRKGYISRTQNTQDRRHIRLALTEKGDQLVDAIFSNVRDWMETRLAICDTSELNTIIAGLDILKKVFA
jgi:DNA-binding MarR family transcriptional regulator